MPVAALLVVSAAFLALVAGGGAPASAAHTKAQGRCAAPAALEQLRPAPLHTVARLAQGAPVVVVAIGSSSTEGIGASSPSGSYPARLQLRLRQHCPTCAIDVINKGVGGETVDQTLARFDRDVLAYRPHLVIWQVGSNDILRGEDLEAYLGAVTSATTFTIAYFHVMKLSGRARSGVPGASHRASAGGLGRRPLGRRQRPRLAGHSRT